MTLAEIVSSTVDAYGALPPPMSFDLLVMYVRVVDPDADVCEIDAAARPYQRGEPGAYTYEPIEAPPEGRT